MRMDFNEKKEMFVVEEVSIKEEIDGNELEEMKPYNIIEDRKQMNERLLNSKEVDEIVSTIEVYKIDTILSFGNKVSQEISKASDMILKSVNMAQLECTDELLHSLGNVMGKVDIEEIRKTTGFFKKLFRNKERHLDKIVVKYHAIGEEVDKVYIQLRQYESEIKQSNKKLEQLFETNVKKYHDLVKYILAGEQGCKELREYIAARKMDMEYTKDESIQFDLITLNQSLKALEQKVYDLKIAEQVAMQSIPMIKMMQFNHIQLVQKINEAFIITLPIFKQTLSQAILLKKQHMQSEAMSALEKKKKEILLANAKNLEEPSILMGQVDLANASRIETLETTFRTIVDGIDKTREMQESTRKNWVEEQEKLKNIRQEFDKMYDRMNSEV